LDDDRPGDRPRTAPRSWNRSPSLGAGFKFPGDLDDTNPDRQFHRGIVETFKVETYRTGATLQVRLTGDFDVEVFDHVHELLRDAQTESKHDVVVDLRGVTFIDTSGIRALVFAALRAGEVDGEFRLIRGPDNVHRVFELAGLDSRLDFVDERDP
jgi:anti-anti-sigma factor